MEGRMGGRMEGRMGVRMGAGWNIEWSTGWKTERGTKAERVQGSADWETKRQRTAQVGGNPTEPHKRGGTITENPTRDGTQH